MGNVNQEKGGVMFVILVAMEKEAQYIHCPNAMVIVTGIGLNNVVRTLSRALIEGKISEKDVFINVGYAGSSCFNIGDVVGVNQVRRLRPSETVNEGTYSIFFSDDYIDKVAPCYTSDDFYEGSRAIPLVDMELFYIRAFFKHLIAFKIVSDNLKANEYEEFNPRKAWAKTNDILNNIVNKNQKVL